MKLTALSLGSLLAVAAFAACGGNGKTTASAADRICYDNLGASVSYLSEADTTAIAKGAKNIKGYDREGNEVSDYKTIAAYDSSTGKFTAVSQGTITCTLAGNVAYTLEVVPAYAADPGNQYAKNANDFNEDRGDRVLGRTHDPSLVETTENGRTVYYMFSTGWADVTTLDGSSTYGNAIHRSTDGMLTWEFMGRTFDVETRQADFLDREAGKWLYDGTCSGYGSDDASWWAPDIVPCPSGGYWLYTCVVDGSSNSQGMTIAGAKYARACILLYHSNTLEAGSFKPVLGSDGKQIVYVQSSIRRNETERDVNAIDPQIIYTPEGAMYMAYGSFGSGNYLIELDPATGLRKDGKGWQTHETIRSYIDTNGGTPEENIQHLYADTRNADADGKAIGWTHAYYGVNISKQNMEAPVIARHDGVKIADETATYNADGEPEGVEGKTYYYTMHSYNGLSDHYQMWGGRSESVTGVYKSTGGGIVYNVGVGTAENEGNKYMGGFDWQASSKVATCKEYASCLTGHNDLFTAKNGLNVAAYIVRNNNATGQFVVQNHQYYLNSKGDICINPNRYAGEIDRSVSEEELFALTDGGKFEMVVLTNAADWSGNGSVAKGDIKNISRTVTLNKQTHKILDGATEIGSWAMYGKGYIKFTFENTLKGTGGYDSRETVYYGVVRPAWLYNRDRSGFTISCMGNTAGTSQSMAMFMNNYPAA